MEDPGRVWLPEVVRHVASFLPRNEVASTLRLIDRATCNELRDICEVSLTEPVPRAASALFVAHWSKPAACRSLSIAQRTKLLRQTAAGGDVATLATATEATGLAPDLSILLAAAEAGNLAICQWLCEPGRLQHVGHPHLQVVGAAAGGGHTPLCEWAWKAKPRGRNSAALTDCRFFYFVAVQDAAQAGHVETLRWLLQRRSWKYEFFSCLLLEAVAESCDLPLLQELYRGEEDRPKRWELFPRLRKELLAAAVASRTPDWEAKAEWCAEQGCELEASSAIAAILKAISDGRLKGEVAAKRVMWLRERRHESPVLEAQSKILAAAIQAGDVVAVRTLLELGLRTAAVNWRRCRRLDLDMVLALHGAGCDLGPPQELAEWACEASQRPILEWLLGTYGGDSLGDDPSCFIWSVRSGDVSLVRWLREWIQGGELGRASTGGGPEGTAGPSMFLDWSPQRVHEMWRGAAVSGNEEMLGLLLEWGCALPVHKRAVLEWVIEQRARSESLGGLKRSVRSVGMWAVEKMDAVRGLLAAVRRR